MDSQPNLENLDIKSLASDVEEVDKTTKKLIEYLRIANEKKETAPTRGIQEFLDSWDESLLRR